MGIISGFVESRISKKIFDASSDIYGRIWATKNQDFANQVWEEGKQAALIIINLFEKNGFLNEVYMSVVNYHANNMEKRPENLLTYISYSVMLSNFSDTNGGSELGLINDITTYFPGVQSRIKTTSKLIKFNFKPDF